MGAIKEPDWTTVGILGSARGAAGATGTEAIGTDHLLAGITAAKGPAREALANAGATRTVVGAVLRDVTERKTATGGDDDEEHSVAAQDVLGDDGGRDGRLTGAAARALTAAMRRAEREGAPKLGAVHLLPELLEEDNRAVGLLAACNVSPEAVRAHLNGDTPGEEDGLDPLLHPVRDILLGRSHYPHKPRWKRWLVKRVGINWASRPAWWVTMETHEQARRLGHGTAGTEHILLAVLATHEVALRHPHMTGEGAPTPDTRYTGSERLARMGLDHATVHDALTGDRVPLTPDPRPAEQYLDEAASPAKSRPAAPGTSPDPGTGPLVDLLLTEPTRARQLVEALATTPDA